MGWKNDTVSLLRCEERIGYAVGKNPTRRDQHQCKSRSKRKCRWVCHTVTVRVEEPLHESEGIGIVPYAVFTGIGRSRKGHPDALPKGTRITVAYLKFTLLLRIYEDTTMEVGTLAHISSSDGYSTTYRSCE